MNIYSIALFLHISGALGFFVVLGLEWIGMSRMRSASLAEEAHAILGLVESSNRLGFVSMLTTVITGVYMMVTVWRGAAWIWVVLGAFVLETLLFMLLSTPRMAAVGKAIAAEKGPLSRGFRGLVNNPILWISIRTRAAIVLGIIFLKIAKPGLGGSLLVIALSIVVGLAVSMLPVPRRERAQEGPAD